MHQLVLHHFDLSPFAEKVRLVLGLKRLVWRSVQIPMILPKPQLMPLTGGYRKTPVLQIGADVYCDTRRIALELERRCPQPSLFPDGRRGLALALSHWSDKPFFNPGAALSLGENAGLPQPLLDDRKAFFNFMSFDRLPQELPQLYTQLRAHAQLVDDQLGDGRAFLLGDAPGWADINAYFVLWMARANIPKAQALLEPLRYLPAWEARMRGLGHGERSELDAETALDLAAAASPASGAGVDSGDPLGLRAGEAVIVAPDDYGKDPVAGELITLNVHEVSLRRRDARVGTVAVHFPRIDYRVVRAEQWSEP
jgi:glutathione S-transferase